MVVAWIVLAVALLGFELHHLAFYALFGAIGAFAAAAVAVVAPGLLVAQLAVAVAVAGIGIVGARPYVSRAIAHRHDGDVARGVHGGLVGQEVLTLDSIGGSDRPGHVRLAGERWLAISGNDEPIPTGTSVVVTAVSGTTLTVWSLHPTGALDPVELDPVELEPVELDHPSPTEADPNHAPEGAEGTTA